MLRGSHDNWEKLVGAVLEREELRRIACCESLSSSISTNFSSRFSFDSVVPAETYETPCRTLELDAYSSNHGAHSIRLEELKKATKNFHNYKWSGQGEFGPVFKGWVDEQTLKAWVWNGSYCKMDTGKYAGVPGWFLFPLCFLTKIFSDIDILQREINYLSQLHHPNLVKLIDWVLLRGRQPVLGLRLRVHGRRKLEQLLVQRWCYTFHCGERHR